MIIVVEPNKLKRLPNDCGWYYKFLDKVNGFSIFSAVLATEFIERQVLVREFLRC